MLTDPYHLPFESNSLDVVVSSSCFEHSEMFWLLFLEIMRVLKPEGLSAMTTFGVTWDPQDEVVTVHSLKIIRGGKKALEAEREAIELLAFPYVFTR